MKKQLSYYAIMMLAIAMALTSCGNEQAETEKEVPLRVTYTIDYSKDLLNLCDLVVTYKGDDGVDVVVEEVKIIGFQLRHGCTCAYFKCGYSEFR